MPGLPARAGLYFPGGCGLEHQLKGRPPGQQRRGAGARPQGARAGAGASDRPRPDRQLVDWSLSVRQADDDLPVLPVLLPVQNAAQAGPGQPQQGGAHAGGKGVGGAARMYGLRGLHG